MCGGCIQRSGKYRRKGGSGEGNRPSAKNPGRTLQTRVETLSFLSFVFFQASHEYQSSRRLRNGIPPSPPHSTFAGPNPNRDLAQEAKSCSAAEPSSVRKKTNKLLASLQEYSMLQVTLYATTIAASKFWNGGTHHIVGMGCVRVRC